MLNSLKLTLTLKILSEIEICGIGDYCWRRFESAVPLVYIEGFCEKQSCFIEFGECYLYELS